MAASAQIETLQSEIEELQRSIKGADLDGVPRCPLCRVQMKLRTAKQGPNSGRQFWGCPSYPQCKGLLPLDADPSSADGVGDGGMTAFRLRSGDWRHIADRPGWRCDFVALGGRLRAADPVSHLGEIYAAAATHAAVYVSQGNASTGIRVTDTARLLGALIRRLVTRGLRPPVDPMVEEAILDTAGLSGGLQPADHPGDLARALQPRATLPGADELRRALTRRAEFQLDDLATMRDGEALVNERYERPFITSTLPSLLGAEIGHSVIPQADLDAMLPVAADWSRRRVDFLLLHPSMDAPLVIEIDGMQHHEAKANDMRRDEELASVGIVVERIRGADVGRPAAEFREGLAAIIRATPPLPVDLPVTILAWGPSIANRVQYAVGEALEAGLLSGDTWTIRLQEPTGIGLTYLQSAIEMADAVAGARAFDIVPSAVTVCLNSGFYELRRSARGRYVATRIKAPAEPVQLQITIDLDHGPFHVLPAPEKGVGHVLIRPTLLPVVPRSRATDLPHAKRVANADAPDSAALQRVLEGVFAKREFQPVGPEPRAQERAIRRLIAGLDTVVLLPTGAGKSLIYQMAGLLQPGLTIVIDPLVSLIDDQIDGLRQQGIDRAIGLSSADTIARTIQEKLRALRSGDALFTFVAPERLQNVEFREAMRELATASPIAAAVVDESHCVSEWGHDFRTSYLDLGAVLRDVCQDATGRVPPLIALTGTASRSVLKDMLIELSIDRADPSILITPSDFDRAELRFDVVRTAADEMLARLHGIVSRLPSLFIDSSVPRRTDEFVEARGHRSLCGIVFCRTVRSTKGPPGVEDVANALHKRLGVRVPVYHGKLDHAGKRRNAALFKSNEATILVATKAYGMGIDKPNIRYVIHLGVPGSIEAYYQEAGRAGRCRQESHCIIVSSPDDKDLLEYFHENSYAGVERDIADVTRLLDLIGPISERSKRDIPMGDDSNRMRTERAIHRLKLLGLVYDYTVDWGGKRFVCKVRPVTIASLDAALLNFVRRSQPGRAIAFQREIAKEEVLGWRDHLLRHARRMIEFIYQTIASSRRRAMEEMSLLASQCSSDGDVRDRILRYLTLSEIADTLDALSDRPNFDFADWYEHFDAIEGGDDARDWRGATGRLLESTPDHPGLLVGRGLAEAVVPEGNHGIFVESLQRGLVSAQRAYGVSEDALAEAVARLIYWTRHRRRAWTRDVYAAGDSVLGDATPKAVIEQEWIGLQDPAHPASEELHEILRRRLRRSRLDLIRAADHHTGVVQ